MDVSRRRLLVGVGGISAVALAGCTGGTPRRTSTAVFVTNDLAEETQVTLRIYELPEGADDPPTEELEQVHLERASVVPEDGFAVGGSEVPDADLRLRVVATAGPEGTYDWERIDERSSIDIRIRESGVRFTELD